jgi:type I restriction enzyme S subunit
MIDMKTQSLLLREVISLDKGKPPSQQPYYGPTSARYLTPEYLRGKAEAEQVKPDANSIHMGEGETIILWDGSNAGEVFRSRSGILASTMMRVRHSSDYDEDYFFYALKAWEDYLKAQTSGSGIPHVDKDVLGNIRLFNCTKPEQSKIAEVLITVDRAIEQTEALITKKQRIKTGLMQDLLTRGIDEDGNIRSEETHEFWDSPLGRIPVEWEVKAIKSLLAQVDPAMRSGPFGSALLKQELVSSGVPLLGIDNVFPELFVRNYVRFVTPQKAIKLKRYRVRPHDLMVTIMGTVGRCCVVPDDIGEALSSKHVWTISLDEGKYLPYLACLQINYSPWVLAHFATDEQGGIMGAIKSETLRTTLLPTPPLPEAYEIEKRMRSLSETIFTNQMSLKKLHSIKTGLMKDLLSGRVPVTPLLNDAETTV